MFVVGLAFAFCAAICFGVQYVPVKTHEIFDGITFQWFMCNGIFMVGVVLSMVFGQFGTAFSNRVVFGGMLWALSNYLVLPLVKLLGIGIGFSLYHVVNLIVGYITGRFGLFGMHRMVGCLPLCDFGCGLILASFVIMIFVEDNVNMKAPGEDILNSSPLLFNHIDEDYREQYHRWRLGEYRGSKDPKIGDLEVPQLLHFHNKLDNVGGVLLGITTSQMGSHLRSVAGVSTHGLPHVRFEPAAVVEASKHVSPPQVVSLDQKEPLLQKCNSEPELQSTRLLDVPRDQEHDLAAATGLGTRLLGVLLALLAGGLAGVQAVPAALHIQDHPNESSTAAIFPQTLGIWISSSMIYLVYSSVARLQGWEVPHSSIQPAYFSGAIWAVGFALMIGGIKQLGYGVGYTLDAVGPIVVASLLSIFVFKEITGRRALALYWGSFACQLAGVTLMTKYGSSPS